MATSMCRVCLGGNIRLISVKNSELIETYQKLTSTKLNKDGGLDTLCYICHTQLVRCRRFADMALQSESYLMEQIRYGIEIKQKTSTFLDHSRTHNMSAHPTQLLTLTDEDDISIKLEEDTISSNLVIDEFNNCFEESLDLNTSDLKDTVSQTEFVDVKFDNSDDEYYSDKNITEPEYVYCDFCNKRFSYKYRLMVHLRIHTEKTKRFKCTQCDQAFMHKSTLNLHIQTHKFENEFACKICSEAFATKVKLASHILSHTGEWQFRCDICQKSFAKSADLKRHSTQAHAPNSFNCSVCSKGFNNQVSFKAHMSTHNAKRKYVCNICDKSFSIPANLKRHMLTHREERPKYPCAKCTKIYSQKHHLTDHLRTHNGERPFTCKICDRSFSYSATLRNHMVIHTGEKPFVCFKCHTPFSQSSTLNRHIRLVHDTKSTLI